MIWFYSGCLRRAKSDTAVRLNMRQFRPDHTSNGKSISWQLARTDGESGHLLASDKSGPTIGKVVPSYFIIPPKRDGSFGPEVDLGERPV